MPGKPGDNESESEMSDGESLNLGHSDDDQDNGSSVKYTSHPTVNDLLQDLDSDDDAPDDVAFSASKKSILDRLHEARKQIEREKSAVKVKKQKQDDLYQQQKKDKLTKCKRKRKHVGDDDEVDDDVDRGRPTDVSEVLASSKSSNLNFPDSDLSEADEQSLNFIPISTSGGLEPVYIEDIARLDPNKMTALQFKQKHLFGGRLKRQSMKDVRKVSEKKRARRHRMQTK